ncbi:hypothetical protein KRR55_19780 [Paeniglutamicibacter sp. ABSL32-1]|uniref:hypothetical protein n=1 Tax=Paeniglutamicibacter quisquiliarum TaxID=2849498 RepID=UPI001C2D6480|nr:hypothetical protein [Paeniglutamicibacter quisquiliarum]MBV1781348.1 hypothetical protein [Paeniglutamicibacter quisquiliarum]
MSTQPGEPSKKPFFQRRGAPLMITGVILIIVFGLFIMADRQSGESLASPMWIGVLLGLGMAGYGLYRALKGPGMLDNPRGGTNNEPM